MEFGLSHEQTLLRDSLAQFLADRAPLARVRRFAAESAANAATSAPTRADDITAGLAELGIPALLIPEAHGGVGLAWSPRRWAIT